MPPLVGNGNSCVIPGSVILITLLQKLLHPRENMMHEEKLRILLENGDGIKIAGLFTACSSITGS